MLDPQNSTAIPSGKVQSSPEHHYRVFLGITIAVSLGMIGWSYYQTYTTRAALKDGVVTAYAYERDPMTKQMQAQRDSDDLSSIEADLEASNYDSLDAELADIEAEVSK